MLVLAYGETGQRITCPHRDAAVPSGSVTITILDESGTELLASTAATKGTFSSTLSTAASAGARSIVAAGVTGLTVGEAIVLTDTGGQTEVAQVEAVNSSTKVITLGDRLARAYASSDAIKSALIYYDADLSTVATWVKGIYYQAIFDCSTWTAGPRSVLFRISDLASTCPITYEHVKRWVPHASVLRDSYDPDGLDDARENAWSIMTALLRGSSRDPDVWRDAADVGLCGGLLAAALFLQAHGKDGFAENLAGKPVGTGGLWRVYWDELGKAPAWFDDDQDRARETGETTPRKNTRVGRGL
jgi:hypothetical protein